MRGAGRAMFAAILLVIAGALNIIYGIGAISDANFYSNSTQYVFSSLHTWGWITVILGVIQLTGGFSLMAGNVYGRVIGITAASLGHRRAAVGRRGLPVLVAGDLRALRDRLHGRRLRRRRAGRAIPRTAGLAWCGGSLNPAGLPPRLSGGRGIKRA